MKVQHYIGCGVRVFVVLTCVSRCRFGVCIRVQGPTDRQTNRVKSRIIQKKILNININKTKAKQVYSVTLVKRVHTHIRWNKSNHNRFALNCCVHEEKTKLFLFRAVFFSG